MDRFYTPYELARELHISAQTVCRWIKAGKLPYIQVSERRRLITESAIIEFLEPKIVMPPKKRVDRAPRGDSKSGNKRSLKTRDYAGESERNMGVKSLRKEIARLWR